MSNSDFASLDDENLDKILSSILYRFNCPDAGDLMDYRWGLTTEEQTNSIKEHLEYCPHCLQEMQSFAGPPTKEQSPTSAKKTGNFRLPSLIAQLIRQPSIVRSSETPLESSQLNTHYYQIPKTDWDLVLSWAIEPEATFTVQGQFFGPEPAQLISCRIDLIEVNQLKSEEPTLPLKATQLDKNGAFSLVGIPTGTYLLWLQTPNINVSIPPLELG